MYAMLKIGKEKKSSMIFPDIFVRKNCFQIGRKKEYL